MHSQQMEMVQVTEGDNTESSGKIILVEVSTAPDGCSSNLRCCINRSGSSHHLTG